MPFIHLISDFCSSDLLKDGSLLWSSDRDGFMHLYRWADGAITQLPRGTLTVQKLIGVVQAAHRAFFTANRDEAIEEHVYSIDYRAPGEPQRLTEAGFSNTEIGRASCRARACQ